MFTKLCPFNRPTGYQLSVGKRTIKICTDKVNFSSVAKISFSGKLPDRIWFTASEIILTYEVYFQTEDCQGTSFPDEILD